MTTLICGSLAFDTISVFQGRFAEHILPEAVHKLNVSFLVPQMRHEYGGCAGNIAYNHAMLGGKPLVVGAVGEDGASYLERLRKLGIATDHILSVVGSVTARAYVMTDTDNNQITSFHPGAMNAAHEMAVPASLPGGAKIVRAILGPDGKQATLVHAKQCAALGISMIFDPGQGMPMFDGTELQSLMDMSDMVMVNDYEAQMLSDKLGKTEQQWAERLRGAIITLGEQGCKVWANGGWTMIAPVKAERVVDPTGCGDAFRGTLLWALEQGMSLTQAAELGNIMGSIKIAHQGGQHHELSAAQLLALHRQHYKPL
jgi:adenosine kinase